MDTFEICGEVIHIPQVARSICLEALNLAKKMFGDKSNEEFHRLMETEISQFMQIAAELVANKAPSFNFNPFDITSYPLDQVQNGQLFKPITDNLVHTSDMMQSLIDSDLEKEDFIAPALIIFTIEKIYEAESKYLEDNDLGYTTFMTEIDSFLLHLKNVCSFMSKLPADIELVTTRIGRKIGAQKGGAAKAGRLSELKEIVLSEAATLHADKPATKASEIIYEKLKTHGLWLEDDSGKPLLVDYTTRFTAWIRDARNQPVH